MKKKNYWCAALLQSQFSLNHTMTLSLPFIREYLDTTRPSVEYLEDITRHNLTTNLFHWIVLKGLPFSSSSFRFLFIPHLSQLKVLCLPPSSMIFLKFCFMHFSSTKIAQQSHLFFHQEAKK